MSGLLPYTPRLFGGSVLVSSPSPAPSPSAETETTTTTTEIDYQQLHDRYFHRSNDEEEAEEAEEDENDEGEDNNDDNDDDDDEDSEDNAWHTLARQVQAETRGNDDHNNDHNNDSSNNSSKNKATGKGTAAGQVRTSSSSSSSSSAYASFPVDGRYEKASPAVREQLHEVDLLRLQVYTMAEAIYLAMKKFPAAEVDMEQQFKSDLLFQAEEVARKVIPQMFRETERLTSLDPMLSAEPVHEENVRTVECFHQILRLLESFDGSLHEQTAVGDEFVDELDQVLASHHDNSTLLDRFQDLFKITSVPKKDKKPKKKKKTTTTTTTTAAKAKEDGRGDQKRPVSSGKTGGRQGEAAKVEAGAGTDDSHHKNVAKIVAPLVGGLVGGLLLGPAGLVVWGANVVLVAGAAAVGVGIGAGTGATVNHIIEKRSASRHPSPHDGDHHDHATGSDTPSQATVTSPAASEKETDSKSK